MPAAASAAFSRGSIMRSVISVATTHRKITDTALKK